MTPFTVVLCRAPGCARGGDLLLDLLRGTVRECPHGVLVSTGCVHGPMVCGRADRTAGAMVAVQPCAQDRRPVGAAVHIGPIRTKADTQALCRWLRGGDLSAELLPTRLLRYDGKTLSRRARLN